MTNYRLKIFLMAIVLTTFIAATTANCEQHVSIGHNHKSYSLETGKTGYTLAGYNAMFGIGGVYIDRGEYASSPALSFYREGEVTVAEKDYRYDSDELGIYLKGGIEPVRNSGLYLLATAGAAISIESHKIELSYLKPHKAPYLIRTTETHAKSLLGGGVGYYSKGVCVSVETDNRRGTYFTVGIVF